MSDPINSPSHYNQGEIEAIDAIEDWGFGEGFNRGCAIKYIARAGHKDGEPTLKDLKKAKWYLDREIKREQKIYDQLMKEYEITVTQTASQLSDGDDKQDNPSGTYTINEYTEDGALDKFHREQPIGCLDDFNVEIELIKIL